jgi:starch synthase
LLAGELLLNSKSMAKVLLASSECAPYAKVGGLGDVIPALAGALMNLGQDVRIVMPKYGNMADGQWQAFDKPMIVNMGCGVEFAKLLLGNCNNVPIYFIEFNKYFGRGAVYGEFGGSYGDNWQRFAFFCRAAVDMCQFIGWSPDIIHCNDWPTGLIPALLSLRDRPAILGNCKSVFTIHNMAHHGYAPRELLRYSGLYDHYWHPFAMEACGSINVMKGALQFANKITTVSENYANEIKTPLHGHGLDDVLRYRAGDLVGICNGLDKKIWNPATDKFLPKNFSAKSMAGKAVCKKELRARANLEGDAAMPVFGVISRFFEQKGLDILCDILPDIMKSMAVQFTILGSGDGHLEWKFCELAKNFNGKISVKIGYDDSMAHLVESGSDFFVMPSRYEPCGLNQMYSMAYGTLPIAHATGGLIDTIENYDEETGSGTGFLFKDLTHSALYNTIGWACSTYYDRPNHLKKMRLSAMRRDFSWTRSAEKYAEIYAVAIGGGK